jgi:hypothetical protein
MATGAAVADFGLEADQDAARQHSPDVVVVAEVKKLMLSIIPFCSVG